MEKQAFLWGAATSAHQTEGQNIYSDWWAWEQAGHVEGGACSGMATDHWHRFREDLANVKNLGLNSYRFSVEWAKVEPTQDKWSQEALTWYDSLLTECESLGLAPMLTIHHFTLPQWLAERGGLCAPDFPELFLRYTELLAKRWQGRVRLWCTLNEPMVLATGSYLGLFMPPAIFSPSSLALASQNLLDAHVLAFDAIKSLDAEAQVGIAHNMMAFLPDRAWHPIECVLTFFFDRFYNRSWLDAVNGKRQHFWVPFLIPSTPQLKRALGRRTIDFLGVNYYTKAYVKWRPRDQSAENSPNMPVGLAFARRKEVQSDLGWAIYPEGFAKLLRSLYKLKVPIYITENGIADRDDKERPAYIFEHLKVVAREITRGLDVRGFYYWSLMDNFEWVKGFGPRFGLYSVDYKNFAREERASAKLLRAICQRHQGQKPEASILEQAWDWFRARA